MGRIMKVLAGIGAFFWELVKVFLLAMAIIVPIRYFLVQPFFVRGASMEPNFLDGEYLVVDELSYRLREPRRGEVIVFQFPNNPSQFFIKRIIALPGETVTIDKSQVTISSERYQNGVVLDEAQYLPTDIQTHGSLTVTLGDNEYFVLGDNRAASSDSRTWGALGADDIIGRAWIRAFPVERFGVMEFPRPGFLGTGS